MEGIVLPRLKTWIILSRKFETDIVILSRLVGLQDATNDICEIGRALSIKNCSETRYKIDRLIDLASCNCQLGFRAIERNQHDNQYARKYMCVLTHSLSADLCMSHVVFSIRPPTHT